MKVYVTREEVNQIVPHQNYVLISLARDIEKVKMRGGGELYIDPSFDWGRHVPVVGEVIAVNEENSYNLQVGDMVVSKYLSVWSALHLGDDSENYGEAKAIEIKSKPYEEAEVCPFVKESEIFCKLTQSGFEPLGDNVILEPVLEVEEKIGSIFIPQTVNADKASEFRKALVASTGNGYEKGQMVGFRYYNAQPLEQDIHRTFETEYYRINKKDIQIIY